MGTRTAVANATPKDTNGSVQPLSLVSKLGQLPGHCEALEQRILESRRLAGQLLQTALREALAGPGGAAV